MLRNLCLFGSTTRCRYCELMVLCCSGLWFRPSRHLGGIPSAADPTATLSTVRSCRSCNFFQTVDITTDLVRKTAELAQIQVTDEEVRRTLALNVWHLILYSFMCADCNLKSARWRCFQPRPAVLRRSLYLIEYCGPPTHPPTHGGKGPRRMMNPHVQGIRFAQALTRDGGALLRSVPVDSDEDFYR